MNTDQGVAPIRAEIEKLEGELRRASMTTIWSVESPERQLKALCLRAADLLARLERADVPDYVWLLRNIRLCAAGGLSFGHQATPQTPERMIQRKEERLQQIIDFCERGGVKATILRDESERERADVPRPAELAEALADFAKKLMAEQKPLPPEFAKVLHDNYWELLSDTKADVPRPSEPVNWRASYEQACEDADAYKAQADGEIKRLTANWRSCQHEIDYLRARLKIAKGAEGADPRPVGAEGDRRDAAAPPDLAPIRAEIEKLREEVLALCGCPQDRDEQLDLVHRADVLDLLARLERADVPPLATHLPTGESCSHTQPPESVKDVENPRVASRLPETATGTLPAGVRQTPRIDGNHHSVRAFARDIDFAVDVTEPREVLLGRFEDVLMRLRWQTVRETIDSLERAGWLNSDDAAGVRATLSAAVPRSIPFTRAPVPGPNRAEGDRRDAATPPADRHKALIDARNDIMAAIVKLRGGYAVKMDACDEAVAALDIAIGLAFSTSADPRVVPATEPKDEQDLSRVDRQP